MVSNYVVYGIEDSFKASKYPMAVDTNAVNCIYTDTIKRLAATPTGSGHDNFLNGIIVQFDLTASNKMWVEMQRYHFIDFVSSQSTMLRSAKMNISNACNEYVDKRIVSICDELQKQYNDTKSTEDYMKLLYSIPSGFQITARMTTNYRQLKTIYQQRRTHKLKEWRDFCKWIETLPYSELITGAIANEC